MERFRKLRLVWGFAIFGLALLLTFTFGMTHEETHANICEKFDGSVGFSGFKIDEARFVTYCNVTNSNYYKLAQSSVESWGYQLTAFMYSIIFMMYVFGLLLIYLAEIVASKNNEEGGY